jgi:AraC family transcriptional regulator, transcriptional activator of the genes for pyochelin and ferripyochelin receptors
MGIRIITPHGSNIDVQRFAKHKGHTVWCWCNVHTLEHNLVFGKRPAAKRSASGKTTGPGLHFVVEFSSAAFRKLAVTGNAALRDFAKRIKKGKAQSLSQEHLIMDAAMQQCISAITNYQGSDDVKSMYMHARVLDLLCLLQENYLRAQQPRIVYAKTEYDKERIIFARDYLLTHMNAPPTLIQLAAIAGINEFKLKHGFKEMFNQTVFGYLADVRLEMARRALREKQKTITQIAFELGYSSMQNFSAAFKKKFGIAPGSVK